MKVIDPGHKYSVDTFDGGQEQVLQFMKRDGEGYPFNRGKHGGTNCQEVIRALIDRVKYLDAQVPALENDIILAGLRSSLLSFEIRAARRHGLELPAYRMEIETVPVDIVSGHIFESPHNPKEPK